MSALMAVESLNPISLTISINGIAFIRFKYSLFDLIKEYVTVSLINRIYNFLIHLFG